MSDKVFFDSNILVYAHTDFDITKQATAQKLISECYSYISTQVLQELANTLSRKFKRNWGDVSKVLADATTNSSLSINIESTIAQACRIADKYSFSFYDSLIISAALSCDCITLFSEDLQNGQVIEGKMTIKNPFT